MKNQPTPFWNDGNQNFDKARVPFIFASGILLKTIFQIPIWLQFLGVLPHRLCCEFLHPILHSWQMLAEMLPFLFPSVQCRINSSIKMQWYPLMARIDQSGIQFTTMFTDYRHDYLSLAPYFKACRYTLNKFLEPPTPWSGFAAFRYNNELCFV